jgi:hypothetical protein
MKVKVSYTIDIDADAWANEFGLDKSEVRADVQQYLARAGHDHVMYNLELSAGPKL